MCRVQGATARDKVNSPNAEFMPNEGTHKRARVRRKNMDAVIRQPHDEPIGIKRHGGHNTTIRVEHGDAVCAEAAAPALPVDYY